MGALLALGFAAHGQRAGTRVAVAAALPLLVTTLYFTYSRSAWIALAIGAVAAVAMHPRRLRLVTIALLLAPASAAAVWVSAGSNALTHLRAPHHLITQDGRRVALVLLALVILSAVIALLTSLGAARLRPGGRVCGVGGALPSPAPSPLASHSCSSASTGRSPWRRTPTARSRTRIPPRQAP